MTRRAPHSRHLLLALAVFAGLASAANLCAQSDRFVAPEFRGAAGALYAGWDDFAAATTPNAPDRQGSAAGFSFTQLEPGAFITSSGNLYSFSGVLSHLIETPDLATAPATVVLQTRTVGNPLDLDFVTLEYLEASVWTAAPAPLAELLFAETAGTPGFGSTSDEGRRFTWSLPPISATRLRITFRAVSTSQSFQAAALDLSPPTPADPYAAWLAARFSTDALDDPLTSGPAADPDSDGLPNLLEYALGGEPLAPASSPPVQSQISNSRLRISFPRRADPALRYAVFASADLVIWEDTPVFTSVGDANLAGPALAHDRVALGPDHPSRFLRLVVTRP